MQNSAMDDQNLACAMAVAGPVQNVRGGENDGGINVRTERKRSRLTLEMSGGKNVETKSSRTDGQRERVWPSSNGPPFLKVAHVQRHRFPSRLGEEETLLTESSGNT